MSKKIFIGLLIIIAFVSVLPIFVILGFEFFHPQTPGIGLALAALMLWGPILALVILVPSLLILLKITRPKAQESNSMQTENKELKFVLMLTKYLFILLAISGSILFIVMIVLIAIENFANS